MIVLALALEDFIRDFELFIPRSQTSLLKRSNDMVSPQSLLPTRFTPVYRSNYSKLPSSLARMTSSLTFTQLALTSQLRDYFRYPALAHHSTHASVRLPLFVRTFLFKQE